MRKFVYSLVCGSGLLLASSTLHAQSQDEIRQAQQALKDKGFDPGPVDGVDGPQTHAALREYQKKQNLTPDGRMGPQTLDALGVKRGSAGTNMKAAGTNIRHSYANGGKDIGEGGKQLGSNVKHGEVLTGAKDFGKGVGEGAAKIGVGTGHAAKNAAKGVKNTVVPSKDKDTSK
jgi:peptidoglycan hydrolase-like protein with peptidoglycan-binding domain